jgi:hypothetical protein
MCEDYKQINATSRDKFNDANCAVSQLDSYVRFSSPLAEIFIKVVTHDKCIA